MDKKSDQFSPEESRKRMEAALRGARISGHKPMSEITQKPKKRVIKARGSKRRGA